MEECNYAYQKYLSTEASHSSHWGVIQHVSPHEALTNVSTKCISHRTTWLHSYSFLENTYLRNKVLQCMYRTSVKKTKLKQKV